VAIVYITQCAENIIIHNIIQICTLFDLYIINVQKILRTKNFTDAGGQSQTIKCLLLSIIYNRGRVLLEMFFKRLLQERDTPTEHSSLLAEEVHTLLTEAINSFSLVATKKQEEVSLLILREKPEGCRRFQGINLCLLAKTWSWMGYTLVLRDATPSFVNVAYGIARKNYNSLCCISGFDRWRSGYCYDPKTEPNVPNDHAAPSE
jgi:hypothetical protein